MGRATRAIAHDADSSSSRPRRSCASAAAPTASRVICSSEIARRWSLVLGIEVTPAQAVLVHARGQGRPAEPHPRHLDFITDIAGYAASWRSCSTMRELRSHLGRHQPTPIDIETEKRAGWREHGILVVAEQDPRLTWPEREMVRQLGARLYGQRGACRMAEQPDWRDQD